MQQCSDDVQQINRRLARVEGNVELLKTAFPVNDIGGKDYEGHRMFHRARAEEAKAVEGFKIDATRKIILGAVGIIMTLLGFGIGPYLRSLLGAP